MEISLCCLPGVPFAPAMAAPVTTGKSIVLNVLQIHVKCVRT